MILCVNILLDNNETHKIIACLMLIGTWMVIHIFKYVI